MSEQRVRILLVEDEEDHAELMRRAFEPRSGKFSLAVAMNLKEAKEYLAKSTPDLLIADLHLPDGNGAELLAAKEEKPRFPVVIMTSHGDEQAAVEAMKGGALDYVVKSELTFAHMPHIAERALREWALIIDHNQTEKTLRESREKYKAIFSNAQVALFRTRISDGKLVEINERYAKMAGYSNVEDCIAEFNASDAWTDPNARNELLRILKEKGSVNDFETEIIRRDGSAIWIVFSATMFPEQGFLEGSIVDINERKQAEEALRESEEKLRNIVEHSTNLFYAHTPEQVLTYLSPQSREFLQCEPEEGMVRWPEFSTDNPLNKEGFTLTNKAIETGERQPPYELELEGKKGRRIWVEVHEAPIVKNSKTVSVVGSLTDITERKQAHEALRESEAQKQALLDGTPDMIIQIDTNMRVLWANSAALNVKPDIAGMTCYKGFINKDNLCEGCSCKKAIETGHVESRIMYHAAAEGVQGESYWDLIGVPLKNNAGEITGAIEIARNITDRKQMENKLRENEAEKKAILDGITTNMRLVNENLETIWANKAAADSANKTSEEMVGHKCYEFWGDDPEKPCDGCPSMKAFRTKKTEQIVRNDQDGTIWDLKAEPVFNETGNLVGVVEIAHDITDKTRLETRLQQAQKMESLGLMAGGVAHDLNNILSGIVTYPELLLMDLPENSTLRRPIKTIQESGMRAVDVVADLLTIARGVAMGKEVLNLNTIVTEYLRSPESQELKNTHAFVDFKAELDPDLLNMSGSPTHIKKVLMNLTTNASEAIEGSGTVTISTANRYLDEPLKGYEDVRIGEYTILTVSDDGSGISEEDLERIFEPFYTKKVMGRSGTGLGLAVVWNTVQDHKGYINVKSSEKGTVFELYFPMTREEVADEREQVPLEDYVGHGEKILVVDDEERQREIAGVLLTKLGYVPEAVSSGEAAIEYLKENPVDLILLDMVMPKGINGRKTYEEIIKIRPGQKAIIATGYAKTKEVDSAQELGAGKYIKKPYTLAKVGLAVKEELEK